ncbi:hypothetical protein [Streptomyces sp. NBC_00453]|uniref:hypothetical protein n=1 Tax=Streptomyces sp. NBC_00453 TaxID=2903653 RepID=UPI002E1ACE64
MLLLAPLLGWHTDGWAGIGWGMVAAVFTAVLPTLILRFGEHRQYWGDRHVRRRQDRMVAAPGVMASVITGTALLHRFDAPASGCVATPPARSASGSSSARPSAHPSSTS